MGRACKNLLVGASVALLGFTLMWSLAGGGTQLETLFKANEAVESLTVKIDVASEGASLEEPIALDLGLGFPLWLHPVGRKAGESPPFGAVPQQTTAGARIEPGASGSFTFTLKGEPGLDELQTTPQLLAGVRVSDIARVGFIGPGTTDWALAGYEITINGKTFASAKLGPAKNGAAGDQKPQQALDDRIAALTKELSDLQDLAKANLATAEDLTRMKEVEGLIAQLQDEKSKLAGPSGVLAGPKAAQAAARARIAEIGQKITPLQAQLADLVALVQSQLATEEDRQRLADVEAALMPLQAETFWLDGQIQGKYPWFVDKSFNSPWREQPSVHSAKVMLLTQDRPAADTRNFVYFRTGGRKYLLGSPSMPLTAAQGPQEFVLDLFAGPLTAADIRGWAVGMLGHPEPYEKTPDRWQPQRIVVTMDERVVYDSDENELDRRSLDAIWVIPPAHKDQQSLLVTNTPIARETFVWEAGKGLGLEADGSKPIDLPPKDDPSFPPPEPATDDGVPPPEIPPDLMDGPPLPPDLILPPGFWWQPPTIVIVPPWWWLLPPGFDPFPWLHPFQIESVRITSGWRINDNFQVQWTISGNEGEIDHYEVALMRVRPHLLLPYGPAIVLSASVPPGIHSFSAPAPGLLGDHRLFLAPVVRAVPKDPATTPHQRIGPARPIFRATANPLAQFTLWNQFTYLHPPLGLGAVSFGGPPPGFGRAVWPFGLAEGHIGVLFDQATPGMNVAVRPQGDAWVRIFFRGPAFMGIRRVTTHAGFLGGPVVPDTATVTMTVQLRNPVTNAVNFTYPDVIANVDTSGVMPALTRPVNSADGGPGPQRVWVRMRFQGGTADPAHPPALFGMRLNPGP
jgi:hypothetical protein